MTPTECVRLCKFIAARCPAMRMQDETPDAWYVDLVEFDLADALEAARVASLDQTFIGIGDLVRECKLIIRHRAGRERIAQLEEAFAAENPPAELHTRPVAALTAGQAVPVDDPTRAERRRLLRAAAHAKRETTEAETAAAAEHRAHKEHARAELDARREQTSA